MEFAGLVKDARVSAHPEHGASGLARLRSRVSQSDCSRRGFVVSVKATDVIGAEAVEEFAKIVKTVFPGNTAILEIGELKSNEDVEQMRKLFSHWKKVEAGLGAEELSDALLLGMENLL